MESSFRVSATTVALLVLVVLALIFLHTTVGFFIVRWLDATFPKLAPYLPDPTTLAPAVAAVKAAAPPVPAAPLVAPVAAPVPVSTVAQDVARNAANALLSLFIKSLAVIDYASVDVALLTSMITQHETPGASATINFGANPVTVTPAIGGDPTVSIQAKLVNGGAPTVTECAYLQYVTGGLSTPYYWQPTNPPTVIFNPVLAAAINAGKGGVQPTGAIASPVAAP